MTLRIKCEDCDKFFTFQAEQTCEIPTQCLTARLFNEMFGNAFEHSITQKRLFIYCPYCRREIEYRIPGGDK